MASYRTIRIVPLFLALVVVAVSIASLISLARYFFFSGNNNTNTTIVQTNTVKDTLLSTAIDRSVRMTVRGRIIADENFRSYQIQISPTKRKMTTYQGYRENVIANVTLDNNSIAYEQFVYALYRANLIAGTQFKGDANDLRGLCATGYIYEFEVLKAGKTVDQLWTSTCKGIRGSLVASYPMLMNLFTSQIPNYISLVSGLWR